ncbi:ABC transporter substrate-binding protein [Colwellia sp. 4_MG-2023]|uniref:MlaC/ttg2D family ABC transporter substrate-binding protein n=1 Tax=unclassified Colwellia TaxID=196834 RepID=UPI001C09E7C6|nr:MULTISPECIES: ABC transporter substrate-binding protein [unclassified Colwellia]MBU2923723.1 ABC transporter substrate-binding protein [Colwellia sp. C2M11]MDO6505754.1 ABC transporter substrate-binding protein [Colwellia sp. 5_MG-2023]MDO6554435.1 ABC transporter substrate-binding protein [Colwellia sp. 4_MG-2023]MDO6652177.1 ABC transporter substrate-binding protein [Colwellia sp. 3_MG-2023]MDO6664654.1 ABC transporter substrate-binding protein [Colwellia sp. 2_MG-2023]
MQRIVNSIVIFLVIFSMSTLSYGMDQSSPYVILEKVGDKLFNRIAASQQEIIKSPEVMQNIVEEELMPSIDYRYASYRILGKHLKNTTKEQREQFVDSMRSYLSRTYATALMQYKNQEIVFEPEKSVVGKKIVGIKVQIVELNSPTIDVIFKMRKNKKTGEWKAFDMVVEGISLLSSKQAELSNKIAKEGIEQVSTELGTIAE